MKKYTLLLPVAGKAQRFLDKGYTMPKPLIMSGNKHIIDRALGSIKLDDCDIVFVVRIDHIYNFSIDKILQEKFGDDIKIVIAEKDTRGSVETCLLAMEDINNDIPLIIYTPDVCFEKQFNPLDVDPSLDGFILTFKANSPDHSYVRLDDDGYAIRTEEKKVISKNAAVGVYYFKTAKMFTKYAEKMIDIGYVVNNEFYICPLYNFMIEDGLKIRISEVEKMHVLGTPQQLVFFNDNVISVFGEKPVALCSDHSGFHEKEKMKEVLAKMNIEFIDFGVYDYSDCDYNDYTTSAVHYIQNKYCDFGVGFCRTGQGVNILANKFRGIRSALISDLYTAEYAIRHNCTNFFALSSNCVPSPFSISASVCSTVSASL